MITFTALGLDISSSTYVFSGTGLFNMKYGMVSHCTGSYREAQYYGSIAVVPG